MAELVLFEFGRPGVIASPNACAVCGWAERGHCHWYVEVHIQPGVPVTYVQPDDATRLARMKLRRMQRLIAERKGRGVSAAPTDVGAAYDRAVRTPIPWTREYSLMLERQDDADRDATRPYSPAIGYRSRTVEQASAEQGGVDNAAYPAQGGGVQ